MSFISFGPTTDYRGTLLSSRESLSSTSVLRLFGSLIFFFITSKTFRSNVILQVWNTIFITWVFQSTSLSCITYEVVYDNRQCCGIWSTLVLRLCGSLIFFFITSKTFSSNPILQAWNIKFIIWIFESALVVLYCLWSGLCFALLFHYHFEIYIKYTHRI